VLVAALATVVVLPFGAAAYAADVSGGCTGSATSYNQAGDVIDNVKAPGPGGTEANPFVLDPQGSVAWQASSKAAITSGKWAIAISGATVKSGAIDNPAKKKSTDGLSSISDLPSYIRYPVQYMLLTDGKLQLQASVDGSGQSCTGTVWITGIGSATGTPLFWMGAGVLLLAVLLFMILLFGTTATTTGAAAPAVESIPGTGVR
jgi:hypothetical protein